MKALAGKTFATKTNNWYAPSREFMEKYPSVKKIVLMDTTSSAGDWSGFFIQQVGKKKFDAYGFSQENNYPNDGFTLYTAETPFYGSTEMNDETVSNAMSCWLQFAYDKNGELR